MQTDPSSQIPGAYDSQAYCNCGDLPGVEHICFLNDIVGITPYSGFHQFSFFGFYFHSYFGVVNQVIFNFPTAQESNSIHANTRSWSVW